MQRHRERPVAERLAIRQAAPVEQRRRRQAPAAALELRHQARLADAWLAEDGNELRPRLAHDPRPDPEQERQLVVAADERRRPSGRAHGIDAASMRFPGGDGPIPLAGRDRREPRDSARCPRVAR